MIIDSFEMLANGGGQQTMFETKRGMNASRTMAGRSPVGTE